MLVASGAARWWQGVCYGKELMGLVWWLVAGLMAASVGLELEVML